MAAKASQTTVLRFGAVKAPVSLYKTTGEVKEAQFETAGPSGGVLKHEYRVVEGEAPKGFDPITGGVVPIIDAEVVEEETSAFLPHLDLADLSNGAPVTERVLVEEGTGTIVSEPRRGIRDAEGAFLDLTDQLKAIDETVKLEEMRVVAFVDVGQIDRSRIIGSYYLKPDDGAGRALDVLYTGLKRNRRAAVVKWGKRTNRPSASSLPTRAGSPSSSWPSLPRCASARRATTASWSRATSQRRATVSSPHSVGACPT